MKRKKRKHWRGFSLFEIISAGVVVDGLLIVWMLGII